MKTCGDLETAPIVGAGTTQHAVIASPDRWLAGLYAAAVRFVAWEHHRVQRGWLGSSLTVVHGTSRRTLSLAHLALDVGEPTLLEGTPLHPLLALGPDARVAMRPLRCGDVVQLDARAGRITRLTLAPIDATVATCSA